MLHHSIIPLLHRSSTPRLRHSKTPSLQHSVTPTLRHSNTPSLQHSVPCIGPRRTGVSRSVRHDRSCSYKAEIGAGEPAEVGEDSREIAVVHSEPGCERGEVLIAGKRRDPATSAGVVGTTDGQGWEFAVGALAVNRAAHDEMMVAP